MRESISGLVLAVKCSSVLLNRGHLVIARAFWIRRYELFQPFFAAIILPMSGTFRIERRFGIGGMF